MVLPKVKSMKSESTFLLPYEMKVCVTLEHRENFHALVGHFFPKAKAVFNFKDPHIIATRVAKKINDEEYHLKISQKCITIEYVTYRGLRNALATVAMMASMDEQGFTINTAVIDDYPVLAHRGVMLDLARGIKPFETLIADIVLAAKVKMSHLHLHLFDSKGVCVKLDALPQECSLDNCYTKEQMKEIVKLAEILALEIIPEFDMPAHSKKLVASMKELGCDIVGDEENTNWTTCPGTEKTYEVYQAVINELVELFPSEYFHIGGDELEFTDVPEIKQLCHWNSCSKCRQKIEEEKLADRQELYYYFILRIYEMVKQAGRKMIMWSDQIDCNRKAVLPNDIIMQFWRVAEKGRGPVENCSMNAQLKMGYKVINSYYPETYIDCEEYMSAKTIAAWRWDKSPECDKELAENVFGSEVCAWEYGNAEKYSHYDRTLAPNIVIMADKLWNGADLVFDEKYEIYLTKAILGPSTPEGLNIFKCFGSVIPPRNDEYAYYDEIKCQKAEITDTLACIEAMVPADHGSQVRTKAYMKSLKNILEKIN